MAPDYVEAMRLMALQKRAGDYVIATGVDHSVRDFVRMAFQAVKIDDWERFVVVDPLLSRVRDAHMLVGDSGKARRDLGWEPTLDLSQIIANMVRYDIASEIDSAPTVSASGSVRAVITGGPFD